MQVLSLSELVVQEGAGGTTAQQVVQWTHDISHAGRSIWAVRNSVLQ